MGNNISKQINSFIKKQEQIGDPYEEQKLDKPPKISPQEKQEHWGELGLQEKLGKAINDFTIRKTKIYLKPGERPPQGQQLLRGKRGAYFYEGGGSKRGTGEGTPKTGKLKTIESLREGLKTARWTDAEGKVIQPDEDEFIAPSNKQRKAYYNIFKREPDSSWSSGDIGLRIRQGTNQMKERRKIAPSSPKMR